MATDLVNPSAPADGSITAPKLNGAQTGSAPIFGARAWVNFNGTGTVAIRVSGNVSSVTDNGVGRYTINFTTALPSANFAVFASSDYQNNSYLIPAFNFTATSVDVAIFQQNVAFYDAETISIVVFG